MARTPGDKVRLYVSKAGSLPGYHVEDDAKTRHRALRACLRKKGADARAVKRRLNVLRIYRKNSRSLRAKADALERRGGRRPKRLEIAYARCAGARAATSGPATASHATCSSWTSATAWGPPPPSAAEPCAHLLPLRWPYSFQNPDAAVFMATHRSSASC